MSRRRRRRLARRDLAHQKIFMSGGCERRRDEVLSRCNDTNTHRGKQRRGRGRAVLAPLAQGNQENRARLSRNASGNATRGKLFAISRGLRSRLRRPLPAAAREEAGSDVSGNLRPLQREKNVAGSFRWKVCARVSDAFSGGKKVGNNGMKTENVDGKGLESLSTIKQKSKTLLLEFSSSTASDFCRFSDLSSTCDRCQSVFVRSSCRLIRRYILISAKTRSLDSFVSCSSNVTLVYCPQYSVTRRVRRQIKIPLTNGERG